MIYDFDHFTESTGCSDWLYECARRNVRNQNSILLLLSQIQWREAINYNLKNIKGHVFAEASLKVALGLCISWFVLCSPKCIEVPKIIRKRCWVKSIIQ